MLHDVVSGSVGSRGGLDAAMDEWMWWIVDGAARPENSAARPRARALFSVDLADAEASAWEWDAPSPFAGHYLTRQPGWIEHRCLLSSFPMV